MGFSMFSTSFFLCLGICLIVIGVLGYFISRELLSQNHKITTMCDLVTTMAQDLQMVKMQQTVDKLQSTIPLSVVGGSVNTLPIATEEAPSSGNNTLVVSTDNKPEYKIISTPVINKIVVSDVETSEDDEDEDSEEAIDESDDDDYESDYESNEKSDDNEIHYEKEEHNLSGSASFEEIFNSENIEYSIHDDTNKVCTLDFDNIENLVSDVDINPVIIVNKLPAENSEKVDEDIPLFEILPENNSDDMKLINGIILSTHIYSDSDNVISRLNSSDEFDFVSSEPVAISEVVETESETNYSKMNLPQLRKLVADRKLATNPTKLKKQELIQLLTSSSEQVPLIAEVDV
jgi:hypothetical protein